MFDTAHALGKIPSGLFIVTARRQEAEIAMLASWVQQCSFEPPLLTLAVNQVREAVSWFMEGTPFAVNILAEGQNAVVSHFARGGKLSEAPFENGVERSDGRPPTLSEALAVLHCQVVDSFPTGDHRLIVGRIVEGAVRGEARPWVHVRKNGLSY
jgi:flavin reductase (DIM6/NTAB) family NADH-FMN oxidoreductase RutF